MKKLVISLFATATLAVYAAGYAEDIYKWKDKSGNTYYSSSKPSFVKANNIAPEYPIADTKLQQASSAELKVTQQPQKSIE